MDFLTGFTDLGANLDTDSNQVDHSQIQDSQIFTQSKMSDEAWEAMSKEIGETTTVTSMWSFFIMTILAKIPLKLPENERKKFVHYYVYGTVLSQIVFDGQVRPKTKLARSDIPRITAEVFYLWGLSPRERHNLQIELETINDVKNQDKVSGRLMYRDCIQEVSVKFTEIKEETPDNEELRLLRECESLRTQQNNLKVSCFSDYDYDSTVDWASNNEAYTNRVGDVHSLEDMRIVLKQFKKISSNRATFYRSLLPEGDTQRMTLVHQFLQGIFGYQGRLFYTGTMEREDFVPPGKDQKLFKIPVKEGIPWVINTDNTPENFISLVTDLQKSFTEEGRDASEFNEYLIEGLSETTMSGVPKGLFVHSPNAKAKWALLSKQDKPIACLMKHEEWAKAARSMSANNYYAFAYCAAANELLVVTKSLFVEVMEEYATEKTDKLISDYNISPNSSMSVAGFRAFFASYVFWNTFRTRTEGVLETATTLHEKIKEIYQLLQGMGLNARRVFTKNYSIDPTKTSGLLTRFMRIYWAHYSSSVIRCQAKKKVLDDVNRVNTMGQWASSVSDGAFALI